jgi:hypothetical protein
MAQIRLWKWQVTHEAFGTPGVTRHRLSEANGYTSLKDPVNEEGSLKIRTPIVPTGDGQRSLPMS